MEERNKGRENGRKKGRKLQWREGEGEKEVRKEGGR